MSSLSSLSDSERNVLHGAYIPEEALSILQRIDHAEYRVMFLIQVGNVNWRRTREEIEEYYRNLPRETVTGYSAPSELVGPQQSRNSRQAGPPRHNQANQGRQRDNEGSQTGATVGGMSEQFAGLGLNSTLLPIHPIPSPNTC